MSKSMPAISELFNVPKRFVRSVHLERDFLDANACADYVVTPAVIDAFSAVAAGLQPKSGRRAWRITGDYGVGKSSFALSLANLFDKRRSPAVSRLAKATNWPTRASSVWPVLLTASRESLVPAIARSLASSVSARRPSGKRLPKVFADLQHLSARAESSGNLADLELLIDAAREVAIGEGAGLALIIDELGKFLEFAVQRPEREDVFVLQRLAEIAARSGDQPFVVVCLLHRGFSEYAERLPTIARHEWEKVAGRFDELVFDQPLAHTATLISASLGIEASKLPSAIKQSARETTRAASMSGWLGGERGHSNAFDATSVYPLHPMLLPVLVRFFSQFGQHERSLFGFLLSPEPCALQAFANRRAAGDTWYGLAEFYDYVRTTFGHRLAGASYRSQWMRLVATVDAASELDELDTRVLKAIALLNLLDADDLVPNDQSIKAAFAPGQEGTVGAALKRLTKSGLLFRHGGSDRYRLWPNSSLSLTRAFREANRTVGQIEVVAPDLQPYVDNSPILARRHYISSGTLRFFEVRHVLATELAECLKEPVASDGLIVIALADTEEARRAALAAATSAPFLGRSEVLVCIPDPLLGVAPELHEVQCWSRVIENTPGIAEDNFAFAEASRQLVAARHALRSRLESFLEIRRRSRAELAWYRNGAAESVPSGAGVTSHLSTICDALFPKSPKIENELLNRSVLSSAASAARMRLIQGIFAASDQPMLGIDPKKAPPERSMYLSVLANGGVHVPLGESYVLVEPSKKADKLRLRPALDCLTDQIASGNGDRVNVEVLFEQLRRPPYGVRNGVAPLLLAILLRTRAHELAVYENGTFLHRFGASDFLRLTKAPATFELQHCRVEGVRIEVFAQLATAFAAGASGRTPDLLDVVRPLCQFAAQLPEYSRRATTLSSIAIGVRASLLAAREPVTLLFRDLPEACGVPAFSPGEPINSERVARFVSSLQDAIGELRGAYSELLGRVTKHVTHALGDERFERVRLAGRASKVSLAAREPRLRTFALRLRDPGLSNDAWAEAIGSFLISKPPSKWVAGDESRFCEEVGALGELFHKVEATAFGSGDLHAAVDSIRLNLTRGDGVDLVRIIEPQSNDEAVATMAHAFAANLPQDRSARLEVLTRLLWKELSPESAVPAAETPKPRGDRPLQHGNPDRPR